MIIPELGSFITHYIPAKHVAGESVFVPPTRIITFNPLLRINDGSLASSIVKTYGFSYNEACKYVSNSVWNIRRQLREVGSFEFNGLGVLYLDVNGTCRFSPSDISLPAPNLYALEVVYMQKIGSILHNSKFNSHSHTTVVTSYSENKDKYVLSINKDIANYIAAALIAIVCLFAWQRETNLSVHNVQSASLLSMETTYVNNAIEERAVSANDGYKAYDYKIGKDSSDNNASDDITHSGTYVDSMPYTVVLASAVSLKNAKDFILSLQNKGILNAEIIEQGKGTVQVVCGHFESSDKAQLAANAMRKLDQTRDCWVKRQTKEK